jgi:uncharacterized membrane protein
MISGPLPPPQVLERYEQICPGSAERFLTMAEEQSAHRRTIEKAVIASNVARERDGQRFALAIALVFCTAGTILVLNGHDSGAWVMIGSIAGLVSTFLYGSRRRGSAASNRPPDHGPS